MFKVRRGDGKKLRLRAGELVQVRSREEILATLDSRGALDSLPFMPEMLKYSGRQFRVSARADKTCDTINGTGARRMFDTVHLEGLRCDGKAHGGCQALCLLFWKEAWLARVPSDSQANVARPSDVTEDLLHRATRADGGMAPEGQEVFSCQATEMTHATSYMAWWNVMQYVRDVRSGNVSLSVVLKGIAIALFNDLQRRRRGGTYPFIRGTKSKTPTTTLGLVPGDVVKVKSREEILETLDQGQRNRGLWFDAEQIRYCEGKFKVIARPERIINEKTGQMMKLSNCLILDNAVCVGNLSSHPNRLFCPRAIYAYWREVWLERAE